MPRLTSLLVIAMILTGAAALRRRLVHLLTRTTRTWVGAPRG